MQFQPFGLEPIDQNWGAMLGTNAPQLCAVLASDTKAYAVGDPVWFETAPAGQYSIVANCFGGAKPARWELARPDLGVIVAVSPGHPLAPLVNGAMPTVPAGVKAGLSLVWVLPALQRKFHVAGDEQIPLRGRETDAWGRKLVPTEQGLNEGRLFADLRYGAPVAGRSGVALDSTSFTERCGAYLSIKGLAQGMGVAPKAKYIVTFTPS